MAMGFLMREIYAQPFMFVIMPMKIMAVSPVTTIWMAFQIHSECISGEACSDSDGDGIDDDDDPCPNNYWIYIYRYGCCKS